jgi:hypothetical protein
VAARIGYGWDYGSEERTKTTGSFTTSTARGYTRSMQAGLAFNLTPVTVIPSQLDFDHAKDTTGSNVTNLYTYSTVTLKVYGRF